MQDTEYNIIDIIYPIGSIYMSVNTTNPSTLFSNTTWQKIEGKFLLGSSSSHTSGSTGGAETHTLTTAQMPSHNHAPSPHGINWVANEDTQRTQVATSTSSKKYAPTLDSQSDYLWGRTSSTGGGQAHNNMPPYLVVNIWKRTA